MQLYGAFFTPHNSRRESITYDLFPSSRGSEWRFTINEDGCMFISEMTKTQLKFIPTQVQLRTQPLHPLTPTSGKL